MAFEGGFRHAQTQDWVVDRREPAVPERGNIVGRSGVHGFVRPTGRGLASKRSAQATEQKRYRRPSKARSAAALVGETHMPHTGSRCMAAAGAARPPAGRSAQKQEGRRKCSV